MENLELLRERLGEAVEDPESVYEILHPDVVWEMSDAASPMAGIYRGNGKVVLFRSFSSPEAALQAAGLEPDG